MAPPSGICPNFLFEGWYLTRELDEESEDPGDPGGKFSVMTTSWPRVFPRGCRDFWIPHLILVGCRPSNKRLGQMPDGGAICSAYMSLREKINTALRISWQFSLFLQNNAMK